MDDKVNQINLGLRIERFEAKGCQLLVQPVFQDVVLADVGYVIASFVQFVNEFLTTLYPFVFVVLNVLSHSLSAFCVLAQVARQLNAYLAKLAILLAIFIYQSVYNRNHLIQHSLNQWIAQAVVRNRLQVLLQCAIVVFLLGDRTFGMIITRLFAATINNRLVILVVQFAPTIHSLAEKDSLVSATLRFWFEYKENCT